MRNTLVTQTLLDRETRDIRCGGFSSHPAGKKGRIGMSEPHEYFSRARPVPEVIHPHSLLNGFLHFSRGPLHRGHRVTL